MGGFEEGCYVAYDAGCCTYVAKVSSVDLSLGDFGSLGGEGVVVAVVLSLHFVQPLYDRTERDNS